MIVRKGQLYLRREKNGITVYDSRKDRYTFYKNAIFPQGDVMWSDRETEVHFDGLRSACSRDVEFESPFHVNWLIEETCNLDCIYCFADEKMNHRRAKEQIEETVGQILSLNIISVGLTGGEPTLNPYLKNAIEALSGKCAVNIDTNGTLPGLRSMGALLKEANVLVRITVDAVSPELLEMIRPSKTGMNQLFAIKQNIAFLLQNNISVLVHTVVTQYNLEHLSEIGETLVRLGVRRWHLYGVNKSAKCSAIYDEIKVSKDSLCSAYDRLLLMFGGKMLITMYFDENDFGANTILFIDSSGRFFVDPIERETRCIGSAPTPEKIRETLNVSGHCASYLYLPPDA